MNMPVLGIGICQERRHRRHHQSQSATGSDGPKQGWDLKGVKSYIIHFLLVYGMKTTKNSKAHTRKGSGT
jgi:hypothetical protein